MSTLATLPTDIKNACDTCFLYNHLDILGPVVASVYQQPTQAGRLTYFMAAFADGVKLFDSLLITPVITPITSNSNRSSSGRSSSESFAFVTSDNVEEGIRIVSGDDCKRLFLLAYRQYLCHILHTKITQPLCREIETDLRLHIHTKVPHLVYRSYFYFCFVVCL